ncbi:MAG: lyase family protein [Conexivisphaerales archaeon]
MHDDSISTVDGRYYYELQDIRDKLTEKEFFRERIYVELKYLQQLIDAGLLKVSPVSAEEFMKKVDENWYNRVKYLEDEVKHDVKATELYVRELLDKSGRNDVAPYVHIGLTSEDVNSNALGAMYLNALKQAMKVYSELVLKLIEVARAQASTVMIARTHGVPAVPTTFGKEMASYAIRLSQSMKGACTNRPYGKLSGAVGSYNAMHLLNPDFDWISFAKNFVESLGLRFIPVTKQTAPMEGLSDSLHYIVQVNYIMQELSRDLWMYNMLGLVRFERTGVSSSTMPHKVNPVDLEDSEGQAKVSNSLLLLIAYDTIPTRMERDLSDSTVRRNLWQGLAHSFISARRLLKSLNYMIVNGDAMREEAMAHPEVLSEAVQVSIRAQGNEKGYEEVMQKLKNLDKMKGLVAGELGNRLKSLTPLDYSGLSEKQALLAADTAVKIIDDLECQQIT